MIQKESIKKEKSQVIRLIIVLIVTIFTVVFSIMVFFYITGEIHTESLVIGFIDSLMVVLIVSPVIYHVSYPPLLLQINEPMRFESGRKRCSLE